jgi:hypothetical protein
LLEAIRRSVSSAAMAPPSSAAGLSCIVTS